MRDAVTRAKDAIARGDLMLAYDICVSAIHSGGTETALYHQHVLAIARMGDTDNASRLFHEYGLDKSTDAHQQAIGARLKKDSSLALPDGAQRQTALQGAARAYADIFAESRDSYPGVNAASLYFLAGDSEQAERFANQILLHPEIQHPRNYYHAATKAEALLLLRQFDAAGAALAASVDLEFSDDGAKSTTFAQLRGVLRMMEHDAAATKELLKPVRPPEVLFYCGHIFRSSIAYEIPLSEQIADILCQYNVGFAYGALAAGADILVAEAVLATGAELHVIMPFNQTDFIAQSVTAAGEAWLPRFEACLAAARSVTFASEINYVGDPSQFRYASHVAMGLAKLRARNLGVDALQIAIWDGIAASGPAGTAADIETWQNHGGQSCIIPAKDIDRHTERPKVDEEQKFERALAAIIFSDFPGFSKLAETALPAFWDGVMRHVADTLNEHGDAVIARNSWGDALYAVADSASAAAQIAVDLQVRLSGFDYSRLGLTSSSGMRIGIHYGPAYRTIDLVTGQPNFFGTEVSRAARIEPVTPPGAVFVTEPFAAILALENPDGFQCRYVGRVELAKGYGTFPMYRLTANR